jgi:hypothetical protein
MILLALFITVYSWQSKQTCTILHTSLILTCGTQQSNFSIDTRYTYTPQPTFEYPTKKTYRHHVIRYELEGLLELMLSSPLYRTSLIIKNWNPPSLGLCRSSLSTIHSFSCKAMTWRNSNDKVILVPFFYYLKVCLFFQCFSGLGSGWRSGKVAETDQILCSSLTKSTKKMPFFQCLTAYHLKCIKHPGSITPMKLHVTNQSCKAFNSVFYLFIRGLWLRWGVGDSLMCLGTCRLWLYMLVHHI